MSDVEALMWTLDRDPQLTSAFANLTVLDRPPDLDRLRRRMARAVAVVPRLRQRVVPAPARLAPPAWVDVDVDVDHHVRRVTLHPPGSERQLLDLAAVLAAEPFDRDRPLWRFTVVDGLADGRGGLIQQAHHTITDGEGGVRLSLEFLDLERDAAEPPPVEHAAAPPPTMAAGLGVVADTVGHALRRGAGIGRRAVADAVGLAVHPERLPRLAGEVASTTRSVARQVLPRDGARSPLWCHRTLDRRLEVLRVPLADTKAAATALGGSVNDLFVAAVAGGAGAYHRQRGVAVDELRMAMPVSTRTRGGAVGANAFAPTRTVVPVGADPKERFEGIRARLAVTKAEPALKVVGGLAGVLGLLPAPLLVRTTRDQVQGVDFTTSNVRGAPFEVFVAGARVEANHPLGPLMGTAFNATTLSLAGSLDIGIHVDAGAVEDPGALRDAIAASFDELLQLA